MSPFVGVFFLYIQYAMAHVLPCLCVQWDVVGHVLAAQHMWRLKGAKLKGAAGGVGLLLFVCVGERDFCLRSTVSQGQCVLRSFP